MDSSLGSKLPRVVRTADAVGILLFVFGESLGALIFPRWTIAWFSPFFLLGVLVLLVRHSVHFSPTVFRRITDGLREKRSDSNVRLISRLALASRVSALAIGLAAVGLVGYTLQPFQPRLSHNELWNLPVRWDAGWYMGIARGGYDWREELEGRQQSIAFFPLYPIAVRVGGDMVTVPAKILRDPELFGNGNTRVVWGGVLISIVCFTFAVRRLYILTRDLIDDYTAFRTSLLLITYPFALFFSAAYSEALFLLCLVSTVLAWERGQTRDAFWWGLATGLARSNGWAASAALLLDAAFRWRSMRRFLAASGPVLGMCLFSLYIYWLTGDPFSWARAQQGWGRALDPLATVTRRATAISDLGMLGYVQTDPVDALTALSIIVAVATAGFLLFNRRWLYGVLILAYIAPAVLIDLPAAGRMTAPAFPIFLVLASWLKWRPAFWVTAALFGLGQAFLAARFFTWRTPF